MHNRKGWAYGDGSRTSKELYRFTVYFARQLDALLFIKEFSIFKKPTFYFDYFNSGEHNYRKELNIEKVYSIINDYRTSNNLTTYILDTKVIESQHTDTNMDPITYDLLDWYKDEELFIALRLK